MLVMIYMMQVCSTLYKYLHVTDKVLTKKLIMYLR